MYNFRFVPKFEEHVDIYYLNCAFLSIGIINTKILDFYFYYFYFLYAVKDSFGI